MKRIFSATQLSRFLSRLLIAIICVPGAAWAIDLEREDVRQFIDELTSENDFDQSYVESILADSVVQQSILDAMSRPAERVMPWHEYRAIFITPKRINAGVEFYAEHAETLAQIEADTGIPPAMILGIVGVESYFGRITGKNRVLDALVTLGFDYPKRSKFFSSELEQAFLLAREEDFDLLEIKGSYAGAMGPPQFIPSSYRAYAVDGDGDGRRDLLGNWDDILASVANYFAVHKWQAGKPVAAVATLGDDTTEPPLNDGLKLGSTVGALSEAGVFFPTTQAATDKAGLWELEGKEGNEYWVGFDNLYVITRYNRSVMYALAAWELGQSIVREADET